MREFKVKLFNDETDRPPPNMYDAIIAAFFTKNPQNGAKLILKIGSETEFNYNEVDVYFKERKIGTINKQGIDDLLRNRELAGATYHDSEHVILWVYERDELEKRHP